MEGICVSRTLCNVRGIWLGLLKYVFNFNTLYYACLNVLVCCVYDLKHSCVCCVNLRPISPPMFANMLILIGTACQKWPRAEWIHETYCWAFGANPWQNALKMAISLAIIRSFFWDFYVLASIYVVPMVEGRLGHLKLNEEIRASTCDSKDIFQRGSRSTAFPCSGRNRVNKPLGRPCWECYHGVWFNMWQAKHLVVRSRCYLYIPGAQFTNTDYVNPRKVITRAIKCGMELFIYSQPLKLGNGQVISPYTL